METTNSVELDGVAAFWGVEEEDEEPVRHKEDVPWFSLPENDCQSETAESADEAKAAAIVTPFGRQLRLVRGVLVRRRSEQAEPIPGVHAKFRTALILHLAFCFTLTAFLLFYSSLCFLLYYLYITVLHVIYIVIRLLYTLTYIYTCSTHTPSTHLVQNTHADKFSTTGWKNKDRK
jgi:hypothetical protein